MRRAPLALLLAVLLVSTACTGSTPPPDPPPVPSTDPVAAAPATDFPVPGGAVAAGYDVISDLATSGRSAVAVGFVFAGRVLPTFRYSTDEGATWDRGDLEEASRAAMVPGRQEFPRSVTALRDRFVALGASDRESLAWTSRDGRVWRRHVLDARVLDPEADEVEQVVATDTGTLSVGQRLDTDGRPRPMSWRSTDGLTWIRSPLGGTGWASGVATYGDVAVAVGETVDGKDQRAWRSGDGGRTWERVRVPRAPGDSGFRRSLSGVAATASAFVAVGTFYRDEYEPAVYRSGDGRDWSPVASPDLASSESSDGDRVASEGAGTLLVTSESEPYDTPRLWTPRGAGWRPARTPLAAERTRLGAADWSVVDAVPTSTGWLVAAGRSDDEPFETQVWRSSDRGRSFVRASVPGARENAPFVSPFDLVSTRPALVVVGDSQRQPVRWTSGDGRTFGPAVPFSRRPQDALEGGAAHAGRIVAYGSRKVWRGDAIVWSGPLGGPVRASRPGTFGRTDRYATSDIDAVRWLNGRWWAVGERSANGDANRSALIASSPDGLTWTAGRPARTLRKAERPDDGRYWFDVTDLQGSDDVVRSASDITATSRGLLAVGFVARDELGTELPAVWSSTDRGRWRLSELPYAGFVSGLARSVVSRGPVTVVIGEVRRPGTRKALPYVWTSRDGGRSWRGQLIAIPGHDPELRTVVTTATTFVLSGTTGDDPAQPRPWTSLDGVTWTPLTWTGFPVAPGAEVTVPDLETDGPDVVGLARTTNTAGTGTLLFRQRIG